MKQLINGLMAITMLGVCTACATKNDKTVSAAMQRYKGPNTQSEMYTRFNYSPVVGDIGYDSVVARRDPSSIIRIDGLYYVWYTHCTDPKYQWLNADIYYATSPDGKTWTEQGPAVKRGPAGSWDEFSVFTCNILVAEGKYYLVYQAEAFFENKGVYDDVIGLSWSKSPRGPWHKLSDPILLPSTDAVLKGDLTTQAGRRKVNVIKDGSFDSKCVHDPDIVPFNGKYYLYYKGHGWTKEGGKFSGSGTHPADTKWGVAIADQPEGPYVKSEFNPVVNSGHEVVVFPWKSGIGALVDFAGPEAHTAQYAEDGINFHKVSTLEDMPQAPGIYIADKFADNSNGKGFKWGLCHVGGRTTPRNFLVRFDCDMMVGEATDIRWNQYRFYSSVREVLSDPERFGIPAADMNRARNRVTPQRKKEIAAQKAWKASNN